MPDRPNKLTPAQVRAARRAGEAAKVAESARLVRRQRRSRVVVPVVAVLAVILALVVTKLVSGSDKPKSGQQTVTAGSGVVRAVTSVPAATLDAVGVGTVAAFPTAITGAPLNTSGKPEVLYIGAEYCPFCAAERWAVAVALARFGTFTGLGQTASSPSDVYPNTASLSFHGSRFVSSTVAFTGKETRGNQVVGNSYATLDPLTAAEKATLAKYDSPPYVSSDSKGAIPFIYIGGRYLVSGASYSPKVLQGKTHAQIAAALVDPSSPIATGILGTANVITAAICTTTQQQPATVCQAGGVKAAAAKLTGAG